MYRTRAAGDGFTLAIFYRLLADTVGIVIGA
jgi:hypothetical protein